MFSFGEFYSLTAEESNFSVWELFIFTVVGGMGGLIGASFIGGNERVLKWSQSNVKTWMRKYLYVMGITVVFTLLSCILPVLWGR
jgi:H+/Cl- antiporter ClcA